MGLHSAPEKRGWYRKRGWLGIPVGGWVLLTATGALAALILFFATQADNYTATAIGENINTGVEGVQLFGDLDMAPGDTYEVCVAVEHTTWAPGDGLDARVYASDYTAGGLEDALTFKVESIAFTGVPAFPAGIMDCSNLPAVPILLYDGDLAGWGAIGDYAAGLPYYEDVNVPPPAGDGWAAFRFTVALPLANEALANPGETASANVAFEARKP